MKGHESTIPITTDFDEAPSIVPVLLLFAVALTVATVPDRLRCPVPVADMTDVDTDIAVIDAADSCVKNQ